MATKTYKIKVGMSNAEKQAVADNIINKIISGEIPVQDARQIIFDNINVSLSGETVQAIIEEICDILDMKANKDGYYSQLHSGLADNLASPDGVVNEEPYVFRPTAGTTSVSDGYATIKKLKGNTLVFNQMCKPSLTSQTLHGINVVNNGDGSFTLNGTANASNSIAFNNGSFDLVKLKKDHKYLLIGCPINSIDLSLNCNQNYDNGNGLIFTSTSDTEGRSIYIYLSEGMVIENLVFRPQLFNLTKMFGAGNEPTSVEEFKALFPNTYYEYNAGELIHARPLGIRTIGFNAFDGEIEIGGFSADGSLHNDAFSVRSKNFTKVIGGRKYTMTNNMNETLYVCEYDSNYNFIKRSFLYKFTGEFDLAKNTAYVKLSVYRKVDTPLSGEEKIAFHLTHSGYRNGEYEEHWSETRNLNTEKYFYDGMKSAGTAYDELTPTKAIKRIGTYTFTGNEAFVDWEGIGKSLTVEIPNMKAVDSYGTIANVSWALGTRTSAGNVNNSTEFTIAVAPNGRLYIATTKTNDELANALKGQTVYYELETPVETDVEQTRDVNWDYRISDFGTEEIIQATGEIYAPTAHETFYMANLRDEVRNLPKNYISKASFDNFTSALSGALGISIGATYNETTKSYDFSIVKSVEEE